MSFLNDIQEIRSRARQKIENGPVTQDYALNKDEAVGLLNEALATEMVCVLRYQFHYHMATVIHSTAVAEEFREHAMEEQEHAERIAKRIKQLGGKPDMNPATITTRSHTEYKEGTSLADMMREDLIAERIAIETYREMVRYFGEKDPTSRVTMEEILAKEEEHADDLTDLLFVIEPRTGETRGAYADEIAKETSSKSDTGS